MCATPRGTGHGAWPCRAWRIVSSRHRARGPCSLPTAEPKLRGCCQEPGESGLGLRRAVLRAEEPSGALQGAERPRAVFRGTGRPPPASGTSAASRQD